MRFRFTIGGLMAVVVVFAVGFVGLRAATPLWASALFTLTIALLAAAVLATVSCQGRARMAWLGFAVFGWTYLLATFWLWPERNGATAPPFLTKALLDGLKPSNSTKLVTLQAGPTGEETTDLVIAPAGVRLVNLLYYRRIGHTLAAIVFGMLGALLGTLFSVRSTANEMRSAPEGRNAIP